MKKIYLILIFAAFATFSQTVTAKKTSDRDQKKEFDKAEFLFNNNLYSQALPIYLSIDSTEKDNFNLDFKIGVCYLNAPIDNEKSVPYLEKAAANTTNDYQDGSFKEKKAPLEAYYYLGRAYHRNYQFDTAIAEYQKYKTFLDSVKDKATETDVNHQIEMCNTGKMLVADPVNIKVQNLGDSINSKYADYSPVISADESTLIFTSRRAGSTGGKKDVDGQYFEDIYIAHKKDDRTWSSPKNIGPPINTDGHEASIGLSVDGQTVFIYKDDQGDGNIYTSRLLGTQWTTPEKLNENINTKYWEPSASISADGSLLYFTSNRPGGYGGRDIYVSKRLPNGEWGKAKNLGPKINTQYDEDSPYIHPDGKTLYFSSTGHNTMGGFDIFYSTLSDSGTWSNPVNMGYPVNSTGDDIFYVPTADGKRAYYSSFKKDGLGEKDIYMLTYPEKKEQPLTVYTGVVKSIYGDVPDAEIDVTDSATGELIGQYYPNSSTGKYLFILPPGKTYHISYQADNYLFQTENMEVPLDSAYRVINRPITLNPLQVGQKMILKNIFFASGQSTLQAASKEELDKLVAIMKKYPKLVVEIAGHTDSQGKAEMNLKLSQKRAEAVVAYIVEQGVDEKRLTAKGYGDTQPIAINKNPNGSWNWKGMAMNRRFEFTILSTTGVLNVVEKIKVPDKLQPKNKK